jgi:hypothetical protein
MSIHPQIYGAIGLVFDIIGVILLFYYGPPTLPITKEGHAILPFDHNDPNLLLKNKAKYKHHERYSFVALSCLLVGFALQFISAVMQV